MSISTTMLSTFLPSRKIDPGSVKASLRVAIVARAARASMMNGSHRTPAKTRMPRAGAALRVVDAEGDLLPGRGDAGAFLVRRPSAVEIRGGEDAVEDVLLVARGRTPTRDRRPSAGVSGRSRKRYSSPAEKRSEGLAIGSVFRTRTRRPGRSGLGNA